ncbi:GNAT family N-acetyltransferase [Roseateles sp.]|uniref:GNAT family N-acetyltransferase n=1 Tax=Roseateles sp. TaxID=1971397 RepID=UPI003BAD6BAA
MGTELDKPGYRLSFAAEDIDAVAAHAFLTRAYWCEGIPLALIERAIANSLCIALHADADGEHAGQVGFARVVTDRTTFAYLCDVYVLEDHRGQGLADWMVQSLLAHPDLQGLRRFMLFTRDAHPLYARYGFKPLATPDRGMEVVRPGIYLTAPPPTDA